MAQYFNNRSTYFKPPTKKEWDEPIRNPLPLVQPEYEQDTPLPIETPKKSSLYFRSEDVPGEPKLPHGKIADILFNPLRSIQALHTKPGDLPYGESNVGKFIGRAEKTAIETATGGAFRDEEAQRKLADTKGGFVADLLGGAIGFMTPVGGTSVPRQVFESSGKAIGNLPNLLKSRNLAALQTAGREIANPGLSVAPKLGRRLVETAGGAAGLEVFENQFSGKEFNPQEVGMNAGIATLADLALHGAGKAFSRKKPSLKLPEQPKISPMDDVVKAYKAPSLRDVRQRELEEVFNRIDGDVKPVRHTGIKQDIDSLIKPVLAPEAREQAQREIAEAFGGPLSKYKITEVRKPTPTNLVNPKTIKPVNDIDLNRAKTIKDSMVKDGWQGRELLVLKQGSKYQAITGSHRLKAAKLAKLDSVPTHIIDTKDLRIALDKQGAGFGLKDFIRDQDVMQRVIPYLQDKKAKKIFAQELKYQGLDMPTAIKVKPELKPRLARSEPTFLNQSPLPIRSLPKLERRTWTNKDGIPSTNVGTPQLRPRLGLNDNPRVTNPARLEVAAARINTPQLREETLVIPINSASATPNIGDASTFRGKIDRNPVKKRSISDVIKNLRTQFVDDVAPLERLEKNVTGTVASAENSIYKQARLFRGNPEKAHNIIDTQLKPVIQGIEKQGYSYSDLGDYALAVHARDVNAKGINSGFTDAEINAVIQKFGTSEMEAARQQLVKLNSDLLDQLANAGVIEKELVTLLREKHPNYMPLFRSFDDDKVEFAKGISKALANVSSPIKSLKGSDRNVIDPIENMIKNIFQSTNAADRNMVAGQLGRLADLDGTGALVRRLANGEERGRLNAVYAMENGKKVYYEVQPDVYKAIMNLDKESSNFLIKVLAKPASMLRAGATLTPEFTARNPMRDVLQAFVTSKSGFNPIRDVPMALIEIVKSKRGHQTVFNDFLKYNGGFGNIVSLDRKVHQQTVQDIIKQPPGKRFVNVLSGKSLMGVLRAIADVSETTTKLGEYRAAIRKGVSPQEAAYRARDVMDFGRAGASVREANKVAAFLNANIQGKSKLLRAIQENPVGVTTRAITAVTLPTMGVFMVQKYLANDTQRAIIDDAPTWLRDTFWLLPIPGTNQVARIPKPFDLAAPFANLPERTMDYLFNEDPDAFDNFAKSTMANASIPVMITGLMPFMEGMANYSWFRQGPIIPQREQDLSFPDQYDIRTPETAKFVAKGVDKLIGGEGAFRNFGSPRIVDNTIRGLTGGLGSYATSFIDMIAEGTGIVDKKQKPARKISELPVLRAFLVNETGTGKATNDFYDEKDKLTREKGSTDARKQPMQQLPRLKQLESIGSKISAINKQMRVIENDKTIDRYRKRELLDELNEKRNQLARETMNKSR